MARAMSRGPSSGTTVLRANAVAAAASGATSVAADRRSLRSLRSKRLEGGRPVIVCMTTTVPVIEAVQ
ncbi:hypothetical protein B277_13764 [Janibacter hoylei PVAS-1]|uniref:Uncharacterized protein n=1 Tax=Janibacter hoylei PVAS-1 TaxID=1210046 RepID=K1E4F6_9MICO|nr:hypothetical protein B277_13764 [Janibacter hoylei PVAS-1]